MLLNSSNPHAPVVRLVIFFDKNLVYKNVYASKLSKKNKKKMSKAYKWGCSTVYCIRKYEIYWSFTYSGVPPDMEKVSSSLAEESRKKV